MSRQADRERANVPRQSTGAGQESSNSSGVPVRLSAPVAAVLIIAVIVAVGLYAAFGRGKPADGQFSANPRGLPTYKIVEGAVHAGIDGHFYPYRPAVLHVHAGHPFALRLYDRIGGCELDTDFPGLGEDGSTAIADVPVETTKTIILEAPHPGTYTYHRGAGMYTGTIVAADSGSSASQ